MIVSFAQHHVTAITDAKHFNLESGNHSFGFVLESEDGNSEVVVYYDPKNVAAIRNGLVELLNKLFCESVD